MHKHLRYHVRAETKKGYTKTDEIRMTDQNDNLEALMQRSLAGDQRAYASLLLRPRACCVRSWRSA